MKWRILVLTLFLIGVFLPQGPPSKGLGGSGSSQGKFSYNPKPFDKFGSSPSALITFLASENGRRILRMSPSPVAIGLLKFFGEDVSGAPSPFPVLPTLSLGAAQPLTTAVVGCGQSAGTRFNLEPRTGDPFAPFVDGGIFPMPQNEESVDFLLNRVGGTADLIVGAANDFRGFFGGLGGSATGFYVHRSASDCTGQFEGGLPSIVDVNGVTSFGIGDPVVAADPERDAFFAADLHFGFNFSIGEFDTSVGVFRTTASVLTNTKICPPGSHEFNDTGCWPTSTAADVQNTFGTVSSTGRFIDKPHLAVDERPKGSAKEAGNVYVTNTVFDFNFGTTTIDLTACTNSLKACSSPITVSGHDGTFFDNFTQLSHVSVRPDGIITVSYVRVNLGFPIGQTFDLKWVICTPAGAPNPPSCSPPTIIVTETQPLPFGGTLAAEDFRVTTYPKHDHQVEPDGTTQTIVVWDRCAAPLIVFGFNCPESDVVITASNNNGTTWSPVTPVNSKPQNQFFPWIKTDRSSNTVNIAYYSSQNDIFQHRVQVFLNQIAPGTVIPNPVGASQALTTLADDPAADPLLGGFFFGDYIGLAARGTTISGPRRAYTSYTYNTDQGIIHGISTPEQNNHLSRFDY